MGENETPIFYLFKKNLKLSFETRDRDELTELSFAGLFLPVCATAKANPG